MDTSVVRAPKGGPWRLRTWPGDASIAHLILTDHTHVPTAAEIAEAAERARHTGARSVRTSALFPSAMTAFAQVGFHVIDRLALLRLDHLPRCTVSTPAIRTHHLYPWQRRQAAAVDQAAFDPGWGNDANSLGDVMRATPQHRSRWVKDTRGGNTMAGFAISGAANRNGYLQRLAVHPSNRREGLANSLVADALAWMQGLRLETVLVNTGVSNAAALALYERFGFTPLEQQLTIAELRFDS